MKPSTSLGTTSNVGMAKPSPSVRLAGNMRCLLVVYRGWRSSVARKFYEVNSRRRCRVIAVNYDSSNPLPQLFCFLILPYYGGGIPRCLGMPTFKAHHLFI